MKFIEVVSVPVSDQQVSKVFYLNIGFKLIIEAPMADGTTWVQLGFPDQTTSIALVNLIQKMAAGSLQGLVLHTEDIVAEVTALKNKGVEVSAIDPTPWGKFASFYDPDGNGMILREE